MSHHHTYYVTSSLMLTYYHKDYHYHKCFIRYTHAIHQGERASKSGTAFAICCILYICIHIRFTIYVHMYIYTKYYLLYIRASEHIDPALPSLQACLEALGVSLCLCLYIYCYSAIAHQNIYTKSLLLPYTKYMYTIHPVRQLTLCSWNFFSRPPRAGLASKPI